MEWLGHLIQSAILTVIWSPISLSHFGPAISHSFFVDDLVIFNKADLKHARVLKDTLDMFCGFSGHKINALKTNIFFSKGVEDSIADTISSLFGFQQTENLKHYLGVPLFHQRVMNSTLQFVVEKVH